ncbi:hypothetical protein BLA9940_02228 [Burkholderia aenigmatica]|uniref:Uncharacterized protein n=1 Tax=Burkholderia aenigmatica TaxID=2015348 RepID=A0A6J5IZQ2_9BURK|nr:hypothetical protein BLA3211_03075 [Burkholderia aenigmatica]VWC54855.1 hypothetical protein BLA9940_02228 [Burkholderia aenigmatica]VWC84672.1 hypothetical protein BLA17378_04161 [Burkholderia aenigmatica]VWD51769.1 hypothetical protein BLA18628_06119 [Burkholderia aenigmatica]
MNERYVCAVARLAARYAARFPDRRVTGRAARPSRVTVPRFKESRHV